MLFALAVIVLFIPVVVFHPTKILHKERMPKKKTKCIVTSNHYSNWDIVVYDIYFNRKFSVLSKIELFKNKFVGAILKGLGAIPVDRKEMTPTTYRNTIGELNKGHQLFIFPEGTRNKTESEEMLDIKNGIIIFASKGDAEIVPMVMHHKPRFLRKNYVIVGEPFKIVGENPKKLTKEEIAENLERYKKVVDELRAELDEYVESKKKKHKKTK